MNENVIEASSEGSEEKVQKTSKKNKVKKAAKKVKPLRKPKAKVLWRSYSNKKNRRGKTKEQLDKKKITLSEAVVINPRPMSYEEKVELAKSMV